MDPIPPGATAIGPGEARIQDGESFQETSTRNLARNDDHQPLKPTNTFIISVPPPYGAQKTVKRELRGVHILVSPTCCQEAVSRI